MPAVVHTLYFRVQMLHANNMTDDYYHILISNQQYNYSQYIMSKTSSQWFGYFYLEDFFALA